MLTKFKKRLSNLHLPRWARILFGTILTFFILIIALYVGLAWYINTHKKEVQASLLEELNGGLTGQLTVGTMEPTFLRGFPRVSLRLENVTLQDSLFKQHNHTLLKAGELEVAVNIIALLRGTIDIKKISISNAAIDMYTDENGYSNTAIAKKKKTKDNNGGSGIFPKLRKLDLENVTLAIDNRQRHKLYKFTVDDLSATVSYSLFGWEADASLKGMAHSMAFNTERGSFIKDKTLNGTFEVTYEDDYIVFAPNRLEIGGEDFTIGAKFQIADDSSDFAINISNESILWKNASHLLSPNISEKLDMFTLKEPIAVKCDLIGDFNAEGDPLIRVNAFIKDNELDTPGGVVSNCNFTGIFTNNNVKDKGMTDANSAIKLYNFKGDYAGLPVNMKQTFILNLEKPIAVGDFSSHFEMPALKSIIDEDLLTFSKGTADMKVKFKADIVNYKISKPHFTGLVNIKNANVIYVPRKLEFKDVSVGLDFTQDDLNISQIVMKSGKSTVNMEGSVKNFLNLYYTDPQKMVLTWNIYSPQLHLGEFMGFLGSRQNAQAAIRKNKKGNFTKEMNEIFEKSNVDMKLAVDKLYYNKFLATNVKANVLLTDTGVILKNAGLKHANGSLAINGSMVQKGKNNQFKLNASVSNVDIRKFFYAFNNFGMTTMDHKNLEGLFSSDINMSGTITDKGTMVPKSMYGKVFFGLKKGKLINFDPIRKVGKFAFPFRDMNNIEFYNLKGDLDIAGEKVTIHPMQINSSVLNMDIEGVYSFGKGTQIYVDVPLRNPKKDKDINDKEELAKRRNRGIVVHLTAEDDKDGKVGVKLGGKKEENTKN